MSQNEAQLPRKKLCYRKWIPQILRKTGLEMQQITGQDKTAYLSKKLNTTE